MIARLERADVDRREKTHQDRPGPDEPSSGAQHPKRTGNRHRDDRDTGLQCQVERAFFEMLQTSVLASRTLGKQDHRTTRANAFRRVAQTLNRPSRSERQVDFSLPIATPPAARGRATAGSAPRTAR